MKTIHKFELTIADVQTIRIPVTAKILCVQTQRGVPCLWVELETSHTQVGRTVEVFGTGHRMHGDAGVDRTYIGTFQIEDALVFHVYEYLGS